MDSSVTLGDFELLQELGRGGMGVVYRARQKSLGRDVAVKVLPAEMAGRDAVTQRFQAEARRMGKLDHPGIAQIYTVGEENATPYFAMQLLPGGTLEDRIRRGPMDARQAAAIAAQVANALDHAHSQGLTHRDIKPANIMFDAQGQAVVTDFGIAKAADDVKLTATGMAVGTPQYMAPEQARGNPTDSRADIYALGCVLYEMVCGRPPFTGDTPVSIAMKHVSDAPMPPDALRSDLPSWLQSIVLKALSKEPADRFTTAADMAKALDAKATVGAVPAPVSPGAAASGTAVMPVAVQRQTNWLPAIIGVIAILGVGLIVGPALQGTGGKNDGPIGGTRAETEPGSTSVPSAPEPREITGLAATASSVLRGEKGTARYKAAGAVDGSRDTAWNEGAPGDGEGEWLEVQLPDEYCVTRVEMIPGWDFFKNDRWQDRWPLNNRVLSARFDFDDGSSIDYGFDTDSRAYQGPDVVPPAVTRKVRIVITRVARGSRSDWHDACIGEVRVHGYPN